MDYISIGKRIAKARKKNKLTQEQLAEILESSPSYISNIERAVKKPSLRMLIKIAIALETSLDYLVLNNYENNKVRVKAESNFIMNKVEELTPYSKKLFFEIINDILDKFIESQQ